MPIVAITGVSRGLGQAMVLRFAAHDCTVYGSARSTESLAALQQELGSPHQFRPVDVAHEADIRDWARAVIDEAGPPDFLINNAAIIRTYPRTSMSHDVCVYVSVKE